MKNKLCNAVLACAMIWCSELFAAAPTAASVERFLAAANADRALQPIRGQLEMLVQTGMGLSIRGLTPTPEQQRSLDRAQEEIIAKYRTELAWDAWKQVFIGAVQPQLTQEEVDEFLAYYAAPQGKTMPAKIPVVIQGTYSPLRERLGALVGRLQIEIKSTAEKIAGPPKALPKTESASAKSEPAK